MGWRELGEELRASLGREREVERARSEVRSRSEARYRELERRVQQVVDQFLTQMKRHGSPGLTKDPSKERKFRKFWEMRGVTVWPNGEWKFFYSYSDPSNIERAGSVVVTSFSVVALDLPWLDIEKEVGKIQRELARCLVENKIPLPRD